MQEGKPGATALIAAVGLVAAAFLGGCGGKKDVVSQAEKSGAGRPTAAEVKAIAEEGFVYGLPIVMNYAVLYESFVDAASGQYKAPIGQIHHEARVYTPADTTVVTPNSDTPYSFVQLDLRAEPVVLSVPAVERSRYYSVMLCDANTYNFGYVGTRATGPEPGDFLVVGPGWSGATPPGVAKVFRSTSQLAMALFRTQLFGPADIENVKKVQAGYRVRPLSAYLKTPAPPAPPALTFPRIDKELVKKEFFRYLDFMLGLIPERPEEREIRARLARIGVGPGRTFSFEDLSLAHEAEILLGMKAGDAKVDAKVDAIGTEINGWRIAAAFGDADFYKGDFLLRAAAAKAGIYGNDAAEAMYPMARSLPGGEPLDGGEHAYTLTFPADQLPPVNAFWSVTMYDGKSQLLVENPLKRYLVNSPMLPGMKKGADGSLTIYIQKDSPGKDKEPNWLPAPAGPIYLVMRLYWPKTEPPSVLPPGAGSWQPPALVKVS